MISPKQITTLSSQKQRYTKESVAIRNRVALIAEYVSSFIHALNIARNRHEQHFRESFCALFSQKEETRKLLFRKKKRKLLYLLSRQLSAL